MLRGGAQHQRVQLLAPGLGVLLRVVQPRERTPVRERELLQVEQHRRRHERAREGAAAGLVGAGHEAAPSDAVEREQPPAGPRADGA